ncbi:GTP 3',8-cyclase MoaA [Chryseolinea sp. T2]|uniref:GTP 3',8-cyclase MoaA n=1 Tax=Chryseolinea sp. T2 TaxID=3129255 RepID=UPI003077E58A
MATLFDNHGRKLSYLRMAVTDRCNLRCFYCMPEEGIRYLPKKDLLTNQEILRLVGILSGFGISKVRLTGGEPFVRPDIMPLIRSLVEIPGIRDVHLTTNGVLTAPHIAELSKLNIAGVNLSLDTLDRDRFRAITHRDEFQNVMRTLHALLESSIPVKINAVVMDGKNTDEIISLVELGRNNPVDIRFIEEMPFNGEGSHYNRLEWTHVRILDHIRAHYPGLAKIHDPEFATASGYRVPGFAGTLGVIAAFSRTFCGTCNRIRVTAQGTLKTCLYDAGVLDVRALLRQSADDALVSDRLLQAFLSRPKDGFEAEASRQSNPVSESMSTIGG